MTSSTFYIQLGLVSLVAAAILLGMNQSPLFAPHQMLSWLTWATFMAFCLSMFSISSKTVHSQDKNLFSKVFIISIMVKLFLSITIIIAYILLQKPQDKYFVFPFFVIYVIFTVYEVHFVTKLAKS